VAGVPGVCKDDGSGVILTKPWNSCLRVADHQLGIFTVLDFHEMDVPLIGYDSYLGAD